MAEKITVAETIRDLFKTAFGDQYRMYRVGDPILPAQSELPAVFITETSISFKQDATGYDEIVHNILIQLVFNKKDELGKPVDGNTLDTILDNAIYARDAATNEYMANSLMGVLRRNITLGNLSIDSISDAKKGIVARPQDMITAEAQVSVQVTELQQVNNRS